MAAAEFASANESVFVSATRFAGVAEASGAFVSSVPGGTMWETSLSIAP